MTANSTSNTPVLIGLGQHVHRPQGPDEAQTPFDLIQTAIAAAEADAGLPSLAQQIDDLCLVNIISLVHDDPASELAARLGADPAQKAYTWIGAAAPQWFVNQAAERIYTGRTKLALICGGEAFRSQRVVAKAQGEASSRPIGPRKKGKDTAYGGTPRQSWMVGDLRDPITELELKYGLMAPLHVYALFENSLRAHEGLTIEQQRRELGEFCEKMSGLAAGNPYAWFPKARTAAEITDTSAQNRMVSFPYTVNMCAIMAVDQSAAVFMTDARTAAELGVPEDKWTYVLGTADAYDIWNVTERTDFHSSPSVRTAVDQALLQAELNLDDIDYLEFYSCFPSAPRITRNMLGLSKQDPRPLTVTGGLPYFGGPGNNYSLHAVCRMAELCRQNPDKTGLLQSLSWYISKHSVGVYSGRPGEKPWVPIPSQTYQKDLDGLQGPPVVAEASGPAVVETYSLFHDREGKPVNGVIVGRLEDGSRCLAFAAPEQSLLTALTEEESIGRQGKVKTKDGFNIIDFG
ncbi:MAG: acetyl-CoA acetyltransferase [Deltaproteobacteria bacterium]|nr:acetyl-CoA acetyltransferase [Deltaproteobacteria bacterium]